MNMSRPPLAESLYLHIGGETALLNFVERLYQYMDTLPEVKPVRSMHAMSLDEAGGRLFHFMSSRLDQRCINRPTENRAYAAVTCTSPSVIANATSDCSVPARHWMT